MTTLMFDLMLRSAPVCSDIVLYNQLPPDLDPNTVLTLALSWFHRSAKDCGSEV